MTQEERIKKLVKAYSNLRMADNPSRKERARTREIEAELAELQPRHVEQPVERVPVKNDGMKNIREWFSEQGK